MAIEKILLAVDNSEGSRKAAALATELATMNPDAHVDVAYVLEFPMLDTFQTVYAQEVIDTAVEDGGEPLARVCR